MSNPRFNPNLLTVPLYIAGKSVEEVKEELGLDEVTKMASNESPLGPSPMAIAAAQAMLSQAHLYPGITERNLRGRLADYIGRGLNENNFILGNGGTDVLRMITQSFVFDGGNTIMGRASFPMYHIFTSAFGGAPNMAPPLPDYGLDLKAMAELIDEDTRLVYLCTPNNPTGHIITQAEADDFMARAPSHVVVVFDEAYYDFVDDPAYADSLAYIKEGRNVLVVRSFSKTAGLANMRVGYLFGPERLVNYVRHAQLPFHTGAIALAAAAASLDDVAYREKHRQVIWEGRDYLFSKICELGLSCLPSQANFLTFMAPSSMEASALVDALLRRGIIIRGMAAFGMPNAARVTVGSPETNEKFLAALRAILEC